MPLPLLPGLAKNEDQDEDLHTEEPSGLAQFLDGLEDEDIQQLVSEADAYHAANPDPVEDPDADPADADESAEGDDEGSADDPDAKVTPGDTVPAPPPGDDEDPAEGDASGSLDAIDAQLDEDIASASHVLSQMQDLADGDSDAAPDVAKLVKQASSLNDKLAKQRKLLDRALKAEDAQAAAQAGMDGQDALTAMEKLLEAAQALGTKTEAPGMTDKDHPAIKAWAAKVQGKKAMNAPAPAAPPKIAPKAAFGK